MSYISLNTALQTKLATIAGLTVFGKEPKQVGTYPAAAVSALSHTNAFEDLASNKRMYTFIIRFYFRTDEANDPDYEAILEGIVDSAITAIEHDVTLGGACDWAKPTNAKWAYGEKEVPVRVCELTVEMITRVIR